MSERSIFMPLQVKRTGGHKMIIAPDNDAYEQSTQLLTALVKAHLWQRQLNQGKYTVHEIAEKHKLHRTYIQRLLRLNLLAPTLKMQIIDGTQPVSLKLNDLVRLVKEQPVLWIEQSSQLV